MKRVTVRQFIETSPDAAKIAALHGGTLTAAQVLDTTKSIPLTRLNVVLRNGLVSDKIMHEFACRCAERALAHEPRPLTEYAALIDTKRRWVRGEISTSELLRAKERADKYADSELGYGDTVQACLDAATPSAEFAAWETSRHAVWCAVYATGADAIDTERQWQCEELRKLIEEEAQSQ